MIEPITGDKFSSIPGTFFMTIDELNLKKERPSTPYTLVSHQGDPSIDAGFDYILNDPNLIKWYATNVAVSHPKLIPIPVGIAYNGAHDYKEKIFNEVIVMNLEKTNDIYCNFTNHAWVQERRRCIEAMQRNSLTMDHQKPLKEYFVQLKRSKYCLCPIGNGVDTFRMWECLYLGVIPVMTRFVNDDHITLPHYESKLYKQLPLIWIDKWEDFNKETILTMQPEQPANEMLLDFNFWKKLIEVI